MEHGALSKQECGALNRLLDHAKSGNHYALLGIAADANEEQIKRAYYTMSRQWHPDRHFRRDLGDYAKHMDFIFIHITKAYKILSDGDERRQYDRARRTNSSQRDFRSQRGPRGAPLPPRREHISSRSSQSAPSDESVKRQEERKRHRNQGIKQLRDQVRGRVSRAKQYFEQGRKDYEAGKTSAAVSSLHLAVQFDPKNEEYKALYKQVNSEARGRQANDLVSSGENAENFQNYREAMDAYQRAAKLDPPDGLAFFRLGTLIRRIESDPRKALHHIRTAVNKSPSRMEYRLELGDIYSELGMTLNARREYQEVLAHDKRNSRARDGLRNLR